MLIMNNYRYSLQKKGKSICPECGRKTFVLYIDSQTDNILHSTVGKCDRLDKCGYHYTPKQYFGDNDIAFDKQTNYTERQKPILMPQPKPSYIDMEMLKQTLCRYEENRLIQYLYRILGFEATQTIIKHYFIGTSKYWDGATVFWQIDCNGNVRTGKVMQYDSETGKRIKKPFNKISWVHKVLNLPDFNLSQCLFGEHLLTDTTKPVAIVESEKTAIIASVYLPEFIWLACGGCGNLSLKLCAPLKGRKVVLFPDAGKLKDWQEKAKLLSTLCNVSISDLIEKYSAENEYKEGFDIADYLVRFSLDDFNQKT